MITAVGLNPSVDRTLEIEKFAYGGMNRVRASRDDAGGKAVNVAAVAAGLGMQAAVTGFLPSGGAEFIRDRLTGLGVTPDFLPRPGRVRVNLKVLDARGVVTEINERGETVDGEALKALTQRVRERAQAGGYLVLTGSLPPGCPADTYAHLMDAAAQTPCRCVLDAEGEPFRQGLTRKPFLVKPNRMELETYLGRSLPGVEDAARAARELVDKGVTLAAVSLGGEGALLVSRDNAYFAPAVKVRVKSTVGAGDSMVAGMLFALSKGCEEADVLRYGVACAAASVTLEGTRLADKTSCEAMLNQISVKRVSL